MTTTTLTTQQTIALLRHLTAGKTIPQVAVILHTTPRHVTQVAETHGWPDTAKTSRAADVLAEQADQAAHHIPTRAPGPPPKYEPLPDPVVPDVRKRPPTTSPAAPTLTRPDELRVLLNTGKAHHSKRIQTQTNRIFDAIGKLHQMIRDDQEKHSQRREHEQAKAAALAEVARLRKELKAAQDKARQYGPDKTTRAVTYGEFPCPVCDHIFTTKQGSALHRNRRGSTCPKTQAETASVAS